MFPPDTNYALRSTTTDNNDPNNEQKLTSSVSMYLIFCRVYPKPTRNHFDARVIIIYNNKGVSR